MISLISKETGYSGQSLTERSEVRKLPASSSPAIMGPTMVKEFPEIEDFLRMNNGWSDCYGV